MIDTYMSSGATENPETPTENSGNSEISLTNKVNCVIL